MIEKLYWHFDKCWFIEMGLVTFERIDSTFFKIEECPIYSRYIQSPSETGYISFAAKNWWSDIKLYMYLNEMYFRISKVMLAMSIYLPCCYVRQISKRLEFSSITSFALRCIKFIQNYTTVKLVRNQ